MARKALKKMGDVSRPELIVLVRTSPLAHQSTRNPPQRPASRLFAQLIARPTGARAQGTLAITISLWAVGEQAFGINNATASLCGVSLLLLGGVLTWDDCLSERSGWDCFLWFSIMITLAGGLESLGVMQVVSAGISGAIVATGAEWPLALACLLGVYTYSHYFFASTTAQVPPRTLGFVHRSSTAQGTISFSVAPCQTLHVVLTIRTFPSLHRPSGCAGR